MVVRLRIANRLSRLRRGFRRPSDYAGQVGGQASCGCVHGTTLQRTACGCRLRRQTTHPNDSRPVGYHYPRRWRHTILAIISHGARYANDHRSTSGFRDKVR
jgi:hypothetical protein